MSKLVQLKHVTWGGHGQFFVIFVFFVIFLAAAGHFFVIFLEKNGHFNAIRITFRAVSEP